MVLTFDWVLGHKEGLIGDSNSRIISYFLGMAWCKVIVLWICLEGILCTIISVEDILGMYANPMLGVEFFFGHASQKPQFIHLYIKSEGRNDPVFFLMDMFSLTSHFSLALHYTTNKMCGFHGLQNP